MLMGSSGAPASVSYLFVDAESLRQTLRKISGRVFGGVDLPIDWSKLRGMHRKVFYYDAIPVQQAGEDDVVYSNRIAPRRAELSLIERQASYHVRSGDAVYRKRRGNEQKMVDVQLAVDALLMASRGLFGSVTLITGDLDFKPLVSALVDMGVDVHLQYPAKETSDDLLAAADRAEPINLPLAVSWLAAEFCKSHPLPSAVYTFDVPLDPAYITLVVWTDPKFGECRVIALSDGFKIVTGVERGNPNDHRLEITYSDPDLLRIYAAETFHLDVPHW